jgi:hypothetical protein
MFTIANQTLWSNIMDRTLLLAWRSPPRLRLLVLRRVTHSMERGGLT